MLDRQLPSSPAKKETYETKRKKKKQFSLCFALSPLQIVNHWINHIELCHLVEIKTDFDFPESVFLSSLSLFSSVGRHKIVLRLSEDAIKRIIFHVKTELVENDIVHLDDYITEIASLSCTQHEILLQKIIRWTSSGFEKRREFFAQVNVTVIDMFICTIANATISQPDSIVLVIVVSPQ